MNKIRPRNLSRPALHCLRSLALCLAMSVSAGCSFGQSPVPSAASASASATPANPAADRAALAALEASDSTNTQPIMWTVLRGAIRRAVGDPQHPVPPTPMMFYAAGNAGDKETIDWLKAHCGKDHSIDDIDPGLHCTAMQMAVLDKLTTAARFLLDAGASANAVDARTGSAAIFDSTNLDDEATVELLLEHGADPNVKMPSTGLAPLHSAAMEGSVKMAMQLLAHGANPNQGDAKGVAPLHMAALKNRVAMIKALIGKGADPNLASQAGTTPLLVAEREKNEAAIEVLRQLGAVEKPDPLGARGAGPAGDPAKPPAAPKP